MFHWFPNPSKALSTLNAAINISANLEHPFQLTARAKSSQYAKKPAHQSHTHIKKN
jgi:hypothetical protein